MVNLKRIICLANSRKLAGRCIAGREWSGVKGRGSWIRPVSARDNQEVSEYERQYVDGSDPRVLDIIDVPVKKRHPDGCQTENWLIDPGHYWQKVASFSPFELPALADTVNPLWIDGYSTYVGNNDKIPLEAIGDTASSLRLVRVSDIVLKVFAPGEAFGNSKRRVQGKFRHADRNYALWVTDPEIERRYLAKLDGKYTVGSCHLTISLGEPHQGAVYKLIAAIIGTDWPLRQT